MYLTRHETEAGPCWALDGRLLPRQFGLGLLLELQAEAVPAYVQGLQTAGPAPGALLPPVEPAHEIWAAGVTYQRSREARLAESDVGDVYARVYAAERPELFFKAPGWRAVGHGMAIRTRRDSSWSVPEPELVLVINRHLEIVGFCAGNDVSSRSIEGQNPLYLPQAKIWDGACAVGPGISLAGPAGLRDLPIGLEIWRRGAIAFQGETSTARMNRSPEELATYLGRELSFPQGAFLMTGTGVVPPDDLTLLPGDRVVIRVAALVLENEVAA